MTRPAVFDRPAPARVRRALLAGGWYPEGEAACRAAVTAHLAATPRWPGASAPAGTFHGLIAPHAGFAYSGDAAGLGFAGLASLGASLVVVFGSHRGPRGPSTIFLGDAWATPLGELPVAQPLAQGLAAELGLEEEPLAPRRADNGIELLLPFVKHVFPAAELLALGVAAAESALELGRRVGEACRARAGRTVFIGSTDLTHYGPSYDFAPHGEGEAAVRWAREVNDAGFLRRLQRGDAPGLLRHALEERSACCPGAAAATLAAVRAYGAIPSPTLVDHYLSYDVRPSDSFVGYASVLL